MLFITMEYYHKSEMYYTRSKLQKLEVKLVTLVTD